MSATVLEGDAFATLATLPAEAFQCCVTSPPYYRLRDYGVAGQMGLEPTPEAFVDGMVAVFREVRRVLRDDGTLWLNIGDSYASSPPGNVRGVSERSGLNGAASDKYRETLMAGHATKRDTSKLPGIKPKDMIGIPWMLAFALRADGWYLRRDIIWQKPNCMPESVQDRPTSAHEYVFLLTKHPRYFYDAEAIAENRIYSGLPGQDKSGFKDAKNYNGKHADKQRGHSRRRAGFNDRWAAVSRAGRNARSVWTIPPEPFSGAHFATMPTELARRCIAAGSREGDAVVDPFGGAGTTALVAERLKRDATIIELNPAYAAMARARIVGDAPLLTEVA